MGKTQTKKGGRGKANTKTGVKARQHEAAELERKPRPHAKPKTKAKGLGAVEADTTAVVTLAGKTITMRGVLKEPPRELFAGLQGFVNVSYVLGANLPSAKLTFDTTENATKACDMLVVNDPVQLDDYLPLDHCEWRTPDMERLSKMAVESE